MRKCLHVFSALLVVLSFGSASADIQTGLIAHYPLNGTADDASANVNHGIENGGLDYVDGVQGLAASFDGADDYIDLPNGNLPEIYMLEE